MKNFILMFAVTFSVNTFAWGNRGHHTICQAATFLVENPNLRQFLKRREHTYGHLCNTPDIYWKSLSADDRKIGDPTHYLHAQSINPDLKKIPLDYAEVLKKVGEEDVGSLWWRAQQFYQVAQKSFAEIKNTKPPKDFKQQQEPNLAYNQAVYAAQVAMGLMGHFVGDGSMPYHNHADYNGWATGHGGIHAFYEDECVAEMPADLLTNIISKAKNTSDKISFLKANLSVVERMKELAILTRPDVMAVEKLDPIIKPSSDIDGVKIPAIRKEASKTCARFFPLIAKEMGFSAKLLAKLWDQMYEESGSPDLSAYRSFRYPTQADFVLPDYIP